MGRFVARLLLGRPLANTEYSTRKIGPTLGLSTVGVDAIASSAYGPEAVFAVLIPAGAAASQLAMPIFSTIIGLLVILYLSYRQTVAAYPFDGGSFTAARENLGTNAGLLAATALMLDYVLNVAVAISAGVAALVSMFPHLQPHTLELCLGMLSFLALANLRGLQESARTFAFPIYLFISCFTIILIIGTAKVVVSGGNPHPLQAPPPQSGSLEVVGLWLMVHAFANGCSAMTGIEAVSNGVSSFRQPVIVNAHRTLTAMVMLLCFFLGGTAYLSHAYGIGAVPQEQAGSQTILSQLIAAVVGRGFFYQLSMASLLALLLLSANTSFVAFPRLSRLVATNDYLPRPFAIVGRRLVSTVGVLFLAGFAAILLAAFQGVTLRLIPIFAIGAFTTFTISQAGMAIHWLRILEKQNPRRSRHRFSLRLRALINGVGALATGAALLVLLTAKFAEGAWIALLAIATLFILMKMINRHYAFEDRQLRNPGPLNLFDRTSPLVVIPVESWNRLTDKAVEFAVRLSPDVIAVHLTSLGGPEVEEHESALRSRWAHDVEQSAKSAGFPPPRLVLIRSPYRRFQEPVLRFMHGILAENPTRMVAVLIPELMKLHWWEAFLHHRRAQSLRSALLRERDPRLVVIDVPWYLEAPPTPTLHQLQVTKHRN